MGATIDCVSTGVNASTVIDLMLIYSNLLSWAFCANADGLPIQIKAQSDVKHFITKLFITSHYSEA